jgi:hypothetical protein
MYMAQLLVLRERQCKQNPVHYMGTLRGTKDAGAAENHRLCALSSKNFGLTVAVAVAIGLIGF